MDTNSDIEKFNNNKSKTIVEKVIPIRKTWKKWDRITPLYIRYVLLSWMYIKYLFKFYLYWRQHKVLKQSRRIPSVLRTKIPRETFDTARKYEMETNYFNMFTCFYWIIYQTIAFLYVTNTKMWFSSGPILDSLIIWPDSWDYEMGETCVFMVLSICFSIACHLPLELFQTFVIEERYGFNKISLGAFMVAKLKLIIVEVVFSSVTCCVILEIVWKAGRAFFLWLWIFCFVWLLATLAIYPNVIPPIFDTYTPLRSGRLRDRLNKLAQSLDFPLDDILVLHQKWKSDHSDAYFFGLFSSKRIVLYDTLLDGYPEADLEEHPPRRSLAQTAGVTSEESESVVSVPSRVLQAELQNVDEHNRSVHRVNTRATIYDRGFNEYEIEAIVAQKLGHWMLGHAIREIIFPELNLFVFIVIFSLLYENSQLYAAFEVPRNSDKPIILGLKLLYMDVMDIYSLIVDTIMRKFSREREIEADNFAVKMGYGEDLIEALIELNKENLQYPYYDSWYWAFQYSYPNVLDRIANIEAEMKKLA